MASPTLKQLNEDRKKGFRPSVLCSCINDGKVLFLNRRDYKLWMLPQGGIDPGELAEQAIVRELKEELEDGFVKNCDTDFIYFGEDQIQFGESKHGEHKLVTEEGEDVAMIGKKYYFFAVAVLKPEIDLTKTEFNDYFWLNYETATALAGKIYQINKQRVTKECLKLLKKEGLI